MDSEQIHTALMGLNIAISFCPNVQFIRKAHEKQKEEDNGCKKWTISQRYCAKVDWRGIYTCVGTTAQPTVDWMRSRHLGGAYQGS